MLWRGFWLLLALLLALVGWREWDFSVAEMRAAKDLDRLRTSVERKGATAELFAQWEAIHQRIIRYEARTKIDANWPQLLGSSAMMGAEFFAGTPQARYQLWRVARTAFDTVTKRKPALAQGWLNLARAKFELDRASDWRAALSNAVRLGLRGRKNQLDLLRLRFLIADREDTELKALLDRELSLALRDFQAELIQLSIYAHQESIICGQPQFAKIPNVAQSCSHYLGQ